MSPPVYYGGGLDLFLATVIVVVEVYLFFYLKKRYDDGGNSPDPISPFLVLVTLAVFLLAHRSRVPYAVATYNATVNTTLGEVNATVSEVLYRSNDVAKIYLLDITVGFGLMLILALYYLSVVVFKVFGKPVREG